MNKLFLIFALCTTVACQKGNESAGENPESTVVELQSLLSAGSLMVVASDPVDLGVVSGTSGALTKTLTLQNSSTTAATLSISPFAPSTGFSILTNRCSSSLAARKSCDITVQFSSRNKFDGQYNDSIQVLFGESSLSPSSLSLNFKAQVSGKPNPSTITEYELELTLLGQFSSSNPSSTYLNI